MNEKLALKYYDKLTSDLSQEVVKPIGEVDQNTKIIVEHQIK